MVLGVDWNEIEKLGQGPPFQGGKVTLRLIFLTFICIGTILYAVSVPGSTQHAY